MSAKKLGIYIHIPFCASKCSYCDFYSLAGCDDLIPDYQDALLKHIRESAPRFSEYYVDTVYFGGGTPSYYGSKYLISLFNTLKRYYKVLIDSEVTLEANPDSITAGDLRALRKEGFNRISIGAQSARDSILKFLRRPHTFEQVIDAVRMAKDEGFDNISLDLMYGLPAQTREDWADTIARAVQLNPQHLSCYGLKIEEGTPLYQYRRSPEIPDEDTQADMYLFTVSTLAEMGYRQYEISNFATRGKECRHNMKYWTLNEYAGFGASASSCIGGHRFTFVRDIAGYIKAVHTGDKIVTELETISDYEMASEYLMLGLRTTYGISEEEYLQIYKSSFEPILHLLQSYVRMGFAKNSNGRWSFTPRGFLLSNSLIGEILDAQAEHKYHVGMPWRERDYYTTLFD
ncbi:MAG: radical SAM family heme chaperone HemW [Clostridiales bacterium]|jgi:putative oxygen-independent coproporphyrinogen III oxidase|nr:radical SAM family heme chaperone HemW [Clostridiales bacterium]